MSTRGIRPRPVDVKKQLPIVRDLSELDSAEGLVFGNSAPGDLPDNNAAEKGSLVASTSVKKAKDIPIPEVRVVATYSTDYLPLYKPSLSYARNRGLYAETELVEYDLDNEDEDWLVAYNKGVRKLAAAKFEAMLWRLELACAEAAEKSPFTAGASLVERQAFTAAATTDCLTKASALEALRSCVGAKESTYKAVYDYWVSKRKRMKKPILRRLQAPTPASDTNPFNVFRQRERAHRPQTRRRRDGAAESRERLRALQYNLTHTTMILNELLTREQLKRQQLWCEMDAQQLQICLRHDARHTHDELEQRVADACKNNKRAFEPARAHKIVERTTESVAAYEIHKLNRFRKRRRLPPLLLDDMAAHAVDVPPSLLFTLAPQCTDVAAFADAAEPSSKHICLPGSLRRHNWRPRVGRGGRLLFDCREHGNGFANENDTKHDGSHIGITNTHAINTTDTWPPAWLNPMLLCQNASNAACTPPPDGLPHAVLSMNGANGFVPAVQ